MLEIVVLGVGLLFLVWYLVWISNKQAEWYMRYNKISTFYQELTLYVLFITISYFIFIHIPHIQKFVVGMISLLVSSYILKKVIESIA